MKHQAFIDSTECLIARRLDGETFTQQQIADASGLSKRSIQFIEASALRKLARALFNVAPELLDELGACKRADLLRRLNSDLYITGGASSLKRAPIPAKRRGHNGPVGLIQWSRSLNPGKKWASGDLSYKT